MAIAKRPIQHRSDLNSPPTEAAAERFIQGATPLTRTTKKQNKEPVLVRFDPEQLAEIDRRAAGLGLSRSAWVRMMVTQVLKG